MFFRTILLASLMQISSGLNASAEPPVLRLPIVCHLNANCFIQQYMDVDDTGGARDFAGGQATYDGHKGTDFRLPTLKKMRTGVNVVAAAAGRVVGVRNDMADGVKIKGKECGNGVVIEHGDGWETQYCHMRQASIIVVKGQPVELGQVLGQVGLSGKTQFPHVHIAVRKDGQKVDPFASDRFLWADDLREALVYQPTQIINIGLADGAVRMDDIAQGKFDGFIPDRAAAAMVGFVRAINLVKGDQIRLILSGPQGRMVAKIYDPVGRAKAQQMYFAGKKAPTGGWLAGEYIVVGEVLRDGQIVDSETHVKIVE